MRHELRHGFSTLSKPIGNEKVEHTKINRFLAQSLLSALRQQTMTKTTYTTGYLSEQSAKRRGS